MGFNILPKRWVEESARQNLSSKVLNQGSSIKRGSDEDEEDKPIQTGAIELFV
jgi:hypothetical protein